MEGPCVDCFRTGEAVVNLDLATAADRWPTFAPVAASRGLVSVHAFPLRLRERVIGALNVFGADRRVLSDHEVRVVGALADVAMISLARERVLARAEVVNEQLQAALASRVVIEQAKGAVARTFHVTVDEAFDLIRSHARRERTGLADLCRRLVAAPETIGGLRPR
jgi:GAF domain-containing protein